ncbi:hypothetical protein [Treponema pectinovorum]|uniref:hypothetical protein n=1 Tax=Treponema pectinovorum TaxID=164 RepID=UPI0011F153DE|nr:hypothetical protein [Treponema pectinovorum]
MEKRLFLIFFALSFFSAICSAQSVNQEQKIQILLWAEKEAYPGINWQEGKVDFAEQDENENPYSLAVSRLKKTGPFFVQGMLYGWKIDYTPYDKMRAVKEYIDFSTVQELTEKELNSIQYENVASKDDRLYCRVEFNRSASQINLYNSWKSINNPKIRGIGYGKLEDGFEGIKQACEQAVKNAVREYWRSRIKNKPKEISLRLLISSSPLIGVEAGRYRVMLDFFMETDRITEYRIF